MIRLANAMIVVTVVAVFTSVYLYGGDGGKLDHSNNNQVVTIKLSDTDKLVVPLSLNEDVSIRHPAYLRTHQCALSMWIQSPDHETYYRVSSTNQGNDLREVYDKQRPKNLNIKRYNANGIKWEYIYNPMDKAYSAYSQITKSYEMIIVIKRVKTARPIEKLLDSIRTVNDNSSGVPKNVGQDKRDSSEPEENEE